MGDPAPARLAVPGPAEPAAATGSRPAVLAPPVFAAAPTASAPDAPLPDPGVPPPVAALAALPRHALVADAQRGALYMLVASFSFASMAACAKLAGDGLPFLAVVFGRSVVVALVALAVVRGRGAPLRAKNRRLLLWRSAAGFAAMASYFYALTRAPLANAVALQYTSPLFVALLSGVTVRERPPPRLYALAAVAFAGVWLIVRPEVSGFSVGALAALASAVFSAFAYLAVRGLRETEATETIVLHFALFSLVASAPGVALLERAPTLAEAGALLAVGLAAACGQLAVTHAFRLAEAAFVSAFSYVAVVFSAGYGVLFFGEVPSAGAAAGAALVIASGVLLSLLEARPAAR